MDIIFDAVSRGMDFFEAAANQHRLIKTRLHKHIPLINLHRQIHFPTTSDTKPLDLTGPKHRETASKHRHITP
jgi:hypothetical protein